VKTGNITKNLLKLSRRCKEESNLRKKSLPKSIGSFGKKDASDGALGLYRSDVSENKDNEQNKIN
jgi:hypothetical protein